MCQVESPMMGNAQKSVNSSRMYFDVTREELLELIATYELENSLRSLATKSKASYEALIDFKRGKATMLGDKNLRKVMAVLRPEAVLHTSKMIKIVGHVAADSEIIYTTTTEQVPLPDSDKLIPDQAVALVMRTDREPLLAPGTILFYNDDHDLTGVLPMFYNKPCAVKVKGGKVLLKRVLEGDTRARFHLEDLDKDRIPTMQNMAVEWAKKIEVAIF